jgi:hypothetical protein
MINGGLVRGDRLYRLGADITAAGRAEGAAVPANDGRRRNADKNTDGRRHTYRIRSLVPPPSGTSLLPPPSAANANANTGTSETTTLPAATPPPPAPRRWWSCSCPDRPSESVRRQEGVGGFSE